MLSRGGLRFLIIGLDLVLELFTNVKNLTITNRTVIGSRYLTVFSLSIE